MNKLVRPKKIKAIFIGNCQANAMKVNACSKGYDCRYLLVCSTDLMESAGIERARKYLESIMPKEEVASLLSSGEIRINPSFLDFCKFDPEILVYNLFHEYNDYFLHKKDEFVIQCDHYRLINIFKKNIVDKLTEDFDLVEIDHENYFERFFLFLERMIKLFPNKKHLVIERIKDSSISSDARSLLKNWKKLQYKIDFFYQKISKNKNIQVIKIDSILKKCLCSYNAYGLFYRKIVKKFVVDKYVFDSYLDIEHPTHLYWNNIVDAIFSIESTNPSIGDIRTIEIVNSMVHSVEVGNNHVFLKFLDKAFPKDIIIYLEAIEAAIFIFGKDIQKYVKDYIKEGMNFLAEASIVEKNLATRLLSICSGKEPLKGLKKDAPVALWGAGERCKAILEFLKRELHIVCIFDNDKNKHGETLFGIQIVCPDYWSEYDVIKTKEKSSIESIIVTSTFFSDIEHSVAANPMLRRLKLIDSTDIFNKQIAFHKRSVFRPTQK